MKIIIENVLYHPSSSPWSIQPKVFEKLPTFTTKVLVCDTSVHMYIQIDGISMGSPFGLTISEFYMSLIEKKYFK